MPVTLAVKDSVLPSCISRYTHTKTDMDTHTELRIKAKCIHCHLHREDTTKGTR